MNRSVRASKRLALTASATVVALALAACGSDSSSSDSSAGGGEEPTTLTVAYNATGDFPEPAATLKAAKASFEAENPGVTIDLEEEVASDDDYHTKMQLRLSSGGDVPDVMYFSPSWVDADAAAGYLSPLDDGLAEWDEWTEFFPEAVRTGAKSADGNTYGVPMAANDIGIWYNKDVFAAAGLPEDWQPTSWDDLRTTAETIKAKVPDAIPAHLYAGKASGVTDAILKTFQPLLYGTGEVLYDFDTGMWQRAGDGFLESMTFISDMYADDLTAEDADVLSPNVWSLIGPWMKDSKLGFVLDGNWMSFAWVEGGPNEWPEWGDRLGVAKMPTQDGGGDGFVTMALRGAVMVRAAESDSPDLAMRFIQHVTNEENSLSISVNSSQLAVRTDVVADPAYSDRPTVSEFSDMLQYASYLPMTEENAKVEVMLGELIEEVALGSLSPEDAVTQYNDRVVELVGADLYAG